MQSNYNKLIKELYLDSNLYVNEFENYTDDIYFWEKLIKKYKPKSILEVGVGNGRLISNDKNNIFIENGCIVIEGNTIKDIGTTDQIKYRYRNYKYE